MQPLHGRSCRYADCGLEWKLSGTGKMVRYAHQQGKTVIIIDPKTLQIEQQ